MPASMKDDTGVEWTRIPSAKAFSTFASYKVVLVAETILLPDGSLQVVNDNWLMTVRGREDIYHDAHHITARKFRDVCAMVRSRESVGRFTCLSTK